MERLRRLNFGIRTQTLPVSADTIIDQLTDYDAADAAKVTDWVRANAGVGDAVDALVGVYQAALDDFHLRPPDPVEASRATGAFLDGVTKDFNALQTEVWELRPRVSTGARAIDRLAVVEGERNDLRRDLAQAQKRMSVAERDLGRTRQRALRQQRRLDQLMSSRAVRAQNRVRSAPLLRRPYRALLKLVGRG